MTRSLRRCRAGATAIEYSMIAALIGLVIVSALGVIGTKTATPYNAVAQAL